MWLETNVQAIVNKQETVQLRHPAHCDTSGKQSLHDMQALQVASGRGPRISEVVGGRHKPIAVI